MDVHEIEMGVWKQIPDLEGVLPEDEFHNQFRIRLGNQITERLKHGVKNEVPEEAKPKGPMTFAEAASGI
jgi:hypothetical protein